MAYFEFPHTRTYDTDLGWLIWAMKKMIDEWEVFSAETSLSFADPINWDITTQYQKNEIVLDADGNGYIARQPVPAGIALTNTAYWTPIFNFSDIADRIRSSVAYNNGDSNTAQIELHENDLVWWDGDIYRVIYDIAAGTQFIIGTNVERFTVDEKFSLFNDLIADLRRDLQDETDARENADLDLYTYIDNADGILSGDITNIQGDILTIQGDITTLGNDISAEVTNRENADILINNAIDGLEDQILHSSDVITVTKYGAVGDGVTDSTEAIQECIDENPGAVIVFPKGIYIISETIELWGASGGQCIMLGGSTLRWNGETGNNSIMLRIFKDYVPTMSSACRIIGGNIDGDLKADYCIVNEAFYTDIGSAKIMNFNLYGIFNGPLNRDVTKSTQANYHNCHIFHNKGTYSLGNSCAMGFSYPDNVITGIVTNRTRYAYTLYSGGNLFVNCHSTIEFPDLTTITASEFGRTAHIVLDPADSGATQENVFTNCYFNVGARVVFVPNRATSLITRIDNSHYTFYSTTSLGFRGTCYLFTGYRGNFVCNDFDVLVGGNFDFYDYFPSSMSANVLPKELRIIGNSRHPEASIFSANNLTYPGDKARSISNANFPTPTANDYYMIGAILMTYTDSAMFSRAYSAPVFIKWSVADQSMEACIGFTGGEPTLFYETCTSAPNTHQLHIGKVAKTVTKGGVEYNYFPIYIMSTGSLSERMSLTAYTLDPYIKCYIRDHLTEDVPTSTPGTTLRLFTSPAGFHVNGSLRLGSTSMSEAQLQSLLALI